MVKKRILVSCYLFLAMYCKSQNLVPNHSFEIYDTCPFSVSQIHFAPPWVDPTNSSSDYFNSCGGSLGGSGIPSNYFGVQNAKDGNAYAGFSAYFISISNYREYIQVRLTDTLKASSCYRLIFYVSIADWEMYGVNTLSAYFSDTAISGPVYTFFPFNPQFIYTDNLVGDDTTWYKVEGTFTASGGEQYMTIGNFKHDAQTIITLVNPNGFEGGAYYYIDDISLTQCNVGVEEMENEEHVRLYPNPASDKLTIESKMQNAEIEIRDVLGQMVYRTKAIAASSTIDVSMLSKGVYFISLQNGKQTINKKFIKQE